MATPIDVETAQSMENVLESDRHGRNKKWHWTPEEDALLTLLVHTNGAANWDNIARHIHGRSGKSCRVRWINQLNPKIDKSPFSEEEQRRLLEFHEKYGNRWSNIATFFPGRTDNQLKNQYHVMMRNRCKKSSAQDDRGSPYANSTLSSSSHSFSNFDLAPLAMNAPSFESAQMIPCETLEGFQMMPLAPPSLTSFPFFYGATSITALSSNLFDGPRMENSDVPYPFYDSSNINVDNPYHQVEPVKDYRIINFLSNENSK